MPPRTSGAPGRPREFCGKGCRQKGFRLRRRLERDFVAAVETKPSPLEADVDGRRIRVAYADPPYVGKAARYYAREPSFAGEVDHHRLIARLCTEFPDGWALSCSHKSLRALLPLCPPEVHLCSWGKPGARVGARTRGLHTTWEALCVVGGRQREPGVRDFLYAQAAHGGGELPGRKPLAFCAFLFDALGLEPGDELVDLFPGTGVVGDAWAHLVRWAVKESVAQDLADVAGDESRARIARPRRFASLLERSADGDESSPAAAGETGLTAGDVAGSLM